MTPPLRAPPARILQARYRTSSAALLARPEGPVGAVDLASGEAVTLRCVERTWVGCEEPRAPEPIAIALAVSRRVSLRQRRPRLVAVVAALTAGVALAAFARSAVDHGGSAARALERRAAPSAEAALRPPSTPPAARPAPARGGRALAVESASAGAERSPTARTPPVVGSPVRRVPTTSQPAPPPDLPAPAPAVDALPLPD